MRRNAIEEAVNGGQSIQSGKPVFRFRWRGMQRSWKGAAIAWLRERRSIIGRSDRKTSDSRCLSYILTVADTVGENEGAALIIAHALGLLIDRVSWSQLSEQHFRVDKWRVCGG